MNRTGRAAWGGRGFAAHLRNDRVRAPAMSEMGSETEMCGWLDCPIWGITLRSPISDMDMGSLTLTVESGLRWIEDDLNCYATFPHPDRAVP
jgi:hypothetical protein